MEAHNGRMVKLRALEAKRQEIKDLAQKMNQEDKLEHQAQEDTERERQAEGGKAEGERFLAARASGAWRV